MTSQLTILTHSRARLAKLWKADGTIASYDESKHYTATSRAVSDIYTLSAELSNLERDPHSAVIRGTYKGEAAAATIDPEHKPGLARKITALYDDAPLNWALIEVDNFTPVADPVRDPCAAIAEYIADCLPPCFHDITHHWQLSSSAGHPSNKGVLKVHLWFYLRHAATSAQLKQWTTSGRALALDTSVFNPVQFHYTSAPLAESGVAIPVLSRSGLTDGLFGDDVELPIAASSHHVMGVSSSNFSSTTLVTWDDDTSGLMALSPTLEWSIEFAREVMFDLNADSDRATWVNDLAALHHETRGCAEALEIAVEWSMTASNFGSRKDVEDRWASFGKYRGGTPMTGRWLLKRRADRHAHMKYDARGEWSVAIDAAADEFALREKLCPQIAKDTRLDSMGRESLAQALFESFKRLGTKYPIAQCRKLLVEPGVKAGGKKQVADWMTGWVYITDEDCFYRMDSEEYLTAQGFNARFNRELPRGENGELTKSASWVVLDDDLVPSVTRGLYLPWAGATFEQGGITCVNTYRPSTTPVAVDVLSADGRGAVEVIKRHLAFLAGGRPEVVNTMIDWMAHNVQKPGVKIRWAPLWKGVEGDGKTVMGELLASVMGRVNVRNVSPKVLGTDFTGWAEGSCVIVLEEIKLTGHNRYDILNALKPFITNGSVEIHSKGKDGRDSINTTNYIAFTNYSDALPLTDTDRRWWIVFTPFSNRGEMEKLVATVAPNLGVYFDKLHQVIQKHPAELRKWLLDHNISATFKPDGSAPDTYEKTMMVSTSRTDEEEAVRDVLDLCEGSTEPGAECGLTVGVTKRLFSSSCMSDALIGADCDLDLTTSLRNRLFSKCGFTKMPKRVKWMGVVHRVWSSTSSPLSPDQVREILDATLNSEQKATGKLDVITKGDEMADLF